MPQQDFLKFVLSLAENTAMLTRYHPRNLSQLLFHAKNEGFDFSVEEMSEVIGKMEANVILRKDGDTFDGTSRLWRQMWGKHHIEYLIDHVVRRHTNEELWLLISHPESEEV